MLLCFVPQGQLSYEQQRAARIRNQTSIYTKAARGLRRLSDGHVIHGEFTARQWALGTKDGNKLKIMRMLSIHHFILRHHLSFVVFFFFLVLYTPCQIKRTFSLLCLTSVLCDCRARLHLTLITAVWQIHCHPVMSISWCHSEKYQRL